MSSVANWRLDGKIAVVTGASEGIGLAVARELLALGAEVLIVSRSESKLAEAVRSLAHPGGLAILAADLTTEGGRTKLLQSIEARGALDILVNNLGQADRDPFVAMNEARARALMEINVFANLLITQTLHPYLKRSKGAVVNVSSVAGQRALPNRLWYGTAKAALDFATKALATEWGADQIRVNGIAPWFTKTPLTAGVLENREISAKIDAITPLQRVAEATDIAQAVAFLTLPASSYITGTVLAVDGGMLAQGGL